MITKYFQKVMALSGLLLILAVPALGREKVRPVVLQLSGDHQFRYAGYYAAALLGYYAEAGLAVELRPGQPCESGTLGEGGSILDLVAEGRVDFAIGAADILLAHDRGLELAVVATIFQKSAVRFFAREETRLRSPADLIGKRLARNEGDPVDLELQALLRSSGLGTGEIWSQRSGSALELLVSGEVDVAGCYALGLPYDLGKAGIAFTELDPAAFGVEFYGDSLVASSRLIHDEPELVTRFREASLKGWRYALEHPEDMVERILLAFPARTPGPDQRGLNRYQAARLGQFILYPYIELGSTSAARWRTMHERLVSLGLLRGRFNPEMVYDPALVAKRSLERRTQTLAVLVGLALLLAAVGLGLSLGLRHLVHTRTAELEAALGEKERALGEKELLMKEIHHRVKNNLALVASLVGLHSSQTEDPEVKTLLEALRGRVETVSRLHERLYKGASAVEVELGPYIRELAEALVPPAEAATRELQLELGPGKLNAKAALSLGLVINELVTNALKHAFPPGRKGRIHIRFSSSDGLCRLEIADDGVGMPPQRRTGSFGLFLVESLASQLCAELETESGSGGTMIRLTFPCAGPGPAGCHS